MTFGRSWSFVLLQCFDTLPDRRTLTHCTETHEAEDRDTLSLLSSEECTSWRCELSEASVTLARIPSELAFCEDVVDAVRKVARDKPSEEAGGIGGGMPRARSYLVVGQADCEWVSTDDFEIL